MSSPKKFSAGTLCRDLSRAWTSENKWTDLVVRAAREGGKSQSIGGSKSQPIVSREIPCHKFVLGSKSTVFQEMLAEDPKAGRLDVDLAPATLSSLINYMYTDQVPVEQMDHSLLLAADKFKLQDLKTKCATAMAGRVGLHNAVKFFLAAVETNSDDLKQTAMNFIVDNLEEMMKSNDWMVSAGGKSFAEAFMDCYLTCRAESRTVTTQSR